MLKSGNIVLQKQAMINNVNYKDNKRNRLSVVLFEFDVEGENYVCTAPLTKNPKAALKYSNSYYYFPYLIFEERKYSCIKISSTNIYHSKDVHYTGIHLEENHMNRVFDKIMNYPASKQREELYKMIRDNISTVKSINKSMKSEEKQMRKKLRKEKIRNAKRGINID